MSKVQPYPWAKAMLDAFPSNIQVDDSIYSEDGWWIGKKTAKSIMDSLESAGFIEDDEHFGEFGVLYFSAAGTPRKGLEFDFDDPQDDGLVGIKFFDFRQ